MMKEFKGYWQVKVGTIKPHGMNEIKSFITVNEDSFITVIV